MYRNASFLDNVNCFSSYHICCSFQDETYVEMLNRQKAEVNALLEAHRKQQLEYFGAIATGITPKYCAIW